MNKPVKIESGEWYFKGCFIQKQNHPSLLPYVVFKDTKDQEVIDTCISFKQAKKLCISNEVASPLYGLKSFLH